MGDGLTTQERIDKEYDELDKPEWQPEEAPEQKGEPEPEPTKEPEQVKEPVTQQEDPQLALLKEEQRKTQARYETLQGMIAKQNKELEELRSLKTEPPAVAKTEPPSEELELEKIAEEYGEPLAKFIKKLRDETTTLQQKEISALREELNQTKVTTGQLAQEQALTAEQQYFAKLDREVPEWKQINGSTSEGIPQDPEFTSFLTQKVPLHDYTYNDLLLHHHSRGDAVKVAELFKMAKPVKQTQPAATQTNPLEQLIEPEKTGKGSTPPAPATKKIFTKAEVAKFDNDYMAYQSGRLNANPEKIEARWNEIQDAISEGRIKD